MHVKPSSNEKFPTRISFYIVSSKSNSVECDKIQKPKTMHWALFAQNQELWCENKETKKINPECMSSDKP